MKTKVKANAKQLHAQVQQEINAGRIAHTPKSPMTHAEREALADGMFEQKYCVDLDDKSLLQRILLHKNSRLSFRLKV
jgi:hypothetical protein